MTPFDILKSINEKSSLAWDDEAVKAYAPFIINRGLSYNMQTIMFANAMNRYPQLDKRMQYDFYYRGIPKGKRYDKWQKKSDLSSDVLVVKEFYGINNEKAEYALKLLTNDQLTMIKEKLKKGGRK
jgi:hypothetical protein